MNDKQSDQQLSQWFQSHRPTPDSEAAANRQLSEQLLRRLPQRRNALPQIIMTAGILLGIVLCIALPGASNLSSIARNLLSLARSVATLQPPTMPAVATYCMVLGFLVLVGFSAVRGSGG